MVGGSRVGRAAAVSLIAAGLLLFPFPVNAQGTAVGGIRGVVYDADFDVPLARVRVVLVETGATTETSPDGTFVIENVPPGRYTIRVLREGYEQEVRSGVVVAPGRLADLRVELASEVIEMDELIVTGEDFLAGTEMELLDIRQSALTLQDAISSELISKAGASDVSGALRLVTGASVVDGKYATVRGLSDRYTGTLLNGVRVPSADPRRRAVQIDMFPTGTVESITVTKTFTPNLQGDFTGGGVDIQTKSVPDGTILAVGVSREWDNLATGEQQFLTYQGGGVPADGKADNRSLPELARPENLPEAAPPLRPTTSPRINEEQLALAEEYDALTTAFDPVIGVSTDSPGPDHSLSVTAGGRFRPGGNDFTIGLLGALTKRDRTLYYGEGQNNNATVQLPGQPLALDRDRTEALGVQEALLGGLGTLVLQPTANHEIALRAILNRAAEDEARFQVEDRGSDESQIDVDQNQALRYTERSMTSYQLHGGHRIPELIPGPFGDLLIDWAYSDNTTEQLEPDHRFFRNRFFYDLEAKIGSAREPGDGTTDADNIRRIYRDIDESGRQYAIDVGLPFTQWTGTPGEIKLGWFDDASDRTSNQLSFTYSFGNQLGGNNETVRTNRTYNRYTTTDPDALWTDVFLETPRIGLSDNRCVEGEWTFRQPCAAFDQLIWTLNPTGADVSYVADQSIGAWYGMVSLPLIRTLELVAGARSESTQMAIQPFNPIDPERDLQRIEVEVVVDEETGRVTVNRSLVDTPPEELAASIDQQDLLPMLGLNYEILPGMKLRASWSETIARPTFRELAPVATIEFLAGDEFVGNPDLVLSNVTNYDLRWEWFPRGGDVLAASVFYKELLNPIERINFQAGGRFFVQPVNYETGRLAGFEIEGRTALDRIGHWARDLSVGANFTKIDSEVDVPLAEQAALEDFGLSQEVRRLQGQPDYIGNFNLTYDNPRTGTAVALFVNWLGRTLVSGAAKGEFGGIPDVIEEAYNVVNLTFSQRLGRGFSLGFKAKNLSQVDRVQIYETPQGETEIKTFRPTPLRISVGMKWEW